MQNEEKMIDLKDFEYDELIEFLVENGEKKFFRFDLQDGKALSDM